MHGPISATAKARRKWLSCTGEALPSQYGLSMQVAGKSEIIFVFPRNLQVCRISPQCKFARCFGVGLSQHSPIGGPSQRRSDQAANLPLETTNADAAELLNVSERPEKTANLRPSQSGKFAYLPLGQLLGETGVQFGHHEERIGRDGVLQTGDKNLRMRRIPQLRHPWLFQALLLPSGRPRVDLNFWAICPEIRTSANSTH